MLSSCPAPCWDRMGVDWWYISKGAPTPLDTFNGSTDSIGATLRARREMRKSNKISDSGGREVTTDRPTGQADERDGKRKFYSVALRVKMGVGPLKLVAVTANQAEKVSSYQLSEYATHYATRMGTGYAGFFCSFVKINV